MFPVVRYVGNVIRHMSCDVSDLSLVIYHMGNVVYWVVNDAH